jgi:hypothetical protein
LSLAFTLSNQWSQHERFDNIGGRVEVRVRLTQLDGKLPNLALMKLAHWHRAKGDDIHFTRNARRDMFEPEYDRVYASAIFTWSAPQLAILRQEFPDAVVGGTGAEEWRSENQLTVEAFIGEAEYENHDYSLYPNFTGSIGFTQRGCRLSCGFCVVPKKEGKPRSVNTVAQLWRGEGHPKHLHLLDNDFFGQSRKQWEARIQEMNDGGFKVCFNQGINTRLIKAWTAPYLASLQYYDDSFTQRRIYTAWDNVEDESTFMEGIGYMLDAGIKPEHILVYMLVGWDKSETWERLFYRFNKMVSMGLRPYPMVYNNERKDLKLFQKWVVRRYYELVSWEDFVGSKGRVPGLHEAAKGLDAAGDTITHKRQRREANLAERTKETISLLDWDGAA